MSPKNWTTHRIGITGANGSLGRSFIKNFRSKGAYVIGITHQPIPFQKDSENSPNKWVQWKCGEEGKLSEVLSNIDILILNHGINPGKNINSKAINDAIEINFSSTWRLIEQFERTAYQNKEVLIKKEVWINTSEAEVQPAFSPGYEISKRLIGQLVSLKWCSRGKSSYSYLKIRKLILGPFKSKLNPIGIMSSDFVASQIINQSYLNLNLIIVTPNPLTYLLIPINELIRSTYFNLTSGRKDEI